MGYDFETDKNYNFEKYVSMTLELNKTCFSKGELILGKIILQPKDGLIQTQLLNPYPKISLDEKHHYEYQEYYYDSTRKTTSSRKKEEEENRPLLSIQMNFSNFTGANILLGITIPFEVKVPETSYPSCIFDSTSYVKHFFIVDFPSIEARKTQIIVIKNNLYFSVYNGLLKAPVSLCLKATKYKYAFFNYGSFNSTITLSKNIFFYNEVIPLMIDIDCPKLSISIKSIRVILNRIIKRNYHSDHKKIRSEKTIEIVSKTIPLKKGESMYHIEEIIQMPTLPLDLNTKEAYTVLDNDKRKYSEKFKNILLFPTCYGGLLTCEYQLKIIFEMDSWFTSNEKVVIPLDIYEPFDLNYGTNTLLYSQENITYTNNINNTTNNIYNNNLFNTQQVPTTQNVYQSNPQIIQNPLIENMINLNENDNYNTTQEEELPSKEEILKQSKSNNNENKDNENDKDGSAPPPSFLLPKNNK